ncbi:MAG: ADP compounds hydrolase NudE [Succinivibrio sp.]|nr:ADP compounds hydrolase NudE [Succinivibrio sp.]
MSIKIPLHKKPEILAVRHEKVSIFHVEQLDLRFSNSIEKTYYRLYGGRGAVIAVPFDGSNFFLSQEYACGFDRYELGLVKGKIDEGETPCQAVKRELQEEIGYDCQKLTPIRKEMTVAPGMMSLKMYPFLCEDLVPRKLSGDEPEPIDLIKMSVSETKDLLFDPDSPLTESRAIACLSIALKMLGKM